MIWNKAKIILPAKRPVIIPHAINNGMAPPWWREPVWCLGEVVLEMGECLFRIGDVYVVDGLLLSHRRSTAAMSMSISAYPRRAFPPFVSAIIGSLYTTFTQNLNYFRGLQRSLLLFKCWHHLYFFIKPGETLTFKKRKQHGITMPPVEDDSGSSSSGEEETGSESEVSSAPSPTSFFSFSTLFFWMWMGKNINIDSQLHCAMFWTSVRFFLVHVGVQSTIVKEIRRNPWSRPFNCPRRCKWEEPSLKLTKRKMHP